MTFDRGKFDKEVHENSLLVQKDADLEIHKLEFIDLSNKYKYAYFWTWMGLPIIQMPEDIVNIQEIICETRPDIIIETGIAWGGSLLFYSSIAASMGLDCKVIGIDTVIPDENRNKILNSNLGNSIELILGSSVDEATFAEVRSRIAPDARVLVILDSHHTDSHVFAELNAWSELVTPGSYIVVCDTMIEYTNSPTDRPRPWEKGNSPLTAVTRFLENSERFTDKNIHNQKATLTFHKGGYLLAIN
jgi:cephalosporin hydroxylase